jgi:hypothetical protein
LALPVVRQVLELYFLLLAAQRLRQGQVVLVALELDRLHCVAISPHQAALVEQPHRAWAAAVVVVHPMEMVALAVALL